MKKIFVAIITSAYFGFNALAMERTPAERGRQTMQAVYTRLAEDLNNNRFTQDDLKAFVDFPTQSHRSLFSEGEKKGYIDESGKINSLVSFLNQNNGEFGSKIIALVKALKEKIAANPSALTEEELQRGKALAGLMKELFQLKEAIKGVAPLSQESDLKKIAFDQRLFENLIKEKEEAPAKQAAEAKAQLEAAAKALHYENLQKEKAAQAQAKSVAAQQQAHERLAAQASAERKAEESAEAHYYKQIQKEKEALALAQAATAQQVQRGQTTEARAKAEAFLKTDEGQKEYGTMFGHMAQLQEKIHSGTLTRKNVDDFISAIRETSPYRSKYIKQLAAIKFFNERKANLNDLIAKLNSLPNEDRSETQQALIAFVGGLLEAAAGINMPLEEQSTLKTRHFELISE